MRAALVATLVVIGIAGVAQLNTPMRLRVEPVSETREPTTRLTASAQAPTSTSTTTPTSDPIE